jgi:hypothetical protein
VFSSYLLGIASAACGIIARISYSCIGSKNKRTNARTNASRGIAPKEPFAGEVISYVAGLTVLGPRQPFYKTVLGEFTNVDGLPESVVARSTPKLES